MRTDRVAEHAPAQKPTLVYADLPKDGNGSPIGRYRVRLGRVSERWRGVRFVDGLGIGEGRQIRELRLAFQEKLEILERIDGASNAPAPTALEGELVRLFGDDGVRELDSMRQRCARLLEELQQDGVDQVDVAMLKQRIAELEDDIEQMRLDGATLTADALNELADPFRAFLVNVEAARAVAEEAAKKEPSAPDAPTSDALPPVLDASESTEPKAPAEQTTSEAPAEVTAPTIVEAPVEAPKPIDDAAAKKAAKLAAKAAKKEPGAPS